MSIQSVGKVYVEREPGFLAVSMTKVVEVQADNICVVCLDSSEFEFSMLDSIFSPTPRDEYLKDMITDMVTDTSDGVEDLFSIVREVLGEHSEKTKREDYSIWSDSYRSDLIKFLTTSLTEIDIETVKIETVAIKGVDNIVFVIFADSDTNTTALLEDENDKDYNLEEIDDVDEDEDTSEQLDE